MTYTYEVSTINKNDGYKKYNDFELAEKYAENLSKEKGVSLISIFNKKLEQESPDFSQERNALFLFLYQLLSVLVPDVLFYNLFAHIPQSTHVVTVAP